jgi:Zn-dependent protease
MVDFELLLAVAIPAIIAITLHEASHGFVAWRLGDPTAYRLGRVTFNPIKHVDLFGTILIPLVMYVSAGFLFGWAKPVPVNPSLLNQPRRDMVLVAAAGPGINLAIALISGFLLSLYGLPERAGDADLIHRILRISIYINVILAVFNLIPLPPLDGGRIAVGLLPGTLAYPLQRLEPWGFWILIGVLFILPLLARQLGQDFDPFSSLIRPIIDWVENMVLTASGLGGRYR